MVVKFYLTKPNTESKLRLVCTYSRKEQLKFTTNHLVHPNYWDAKQQCVIDSMEGAEELNLILQQFRLDVLKKIRELQLKGVTDWPELKDRLHNYLKNGVSNSSKKVKEQKTLSIALTSLFEQFLAAKSADYKSGTVKKYNVLKAIIIEFEEHRKTQITLKEVSYSLLEEFRLYMLNVRKNRNDTGYIKLAGLKCLLRWLIMSNFPIDLKALEVRQTVKSKHDIVTLSDNELNRIACADVTASRFLFVTVFSFRFTQVNAIQTCSSFTPNKSKKRYGHSNPLKPERICIYP